MKLEYKKMNSVIIREMTYDKITEFFTFVFIYKIIYNIISILKSNVCTYKFLYRSLFFWTATNNKDD